MAMRCARGGLASGRAGGWAAVLAGVAAWAVMGVAALAGPLDPPLGPITSTGRTLSEVEPRTPLTSTTAPGDSLNVHVISQSGSYYLTGNVAGVSGKSGIRIVASNVTLDLSGFSVVGVAGSGNGITAGAVTGVQVRNGTVSNWGSAGIDVSSASSPLIESVVAHGNGGFGVRNGRQGMTRFCTARSNGTVGFIAYDGGVVESCAAMSNGTTGFATGAATVVRGCLSRANLGTGIDASAGSVVSECVAYDNDGSGIVVASASTVERCVARLNGLDGIAATFSTSVRGNTCASNGDAGTGAGIRVANSDCRVEGNVCVDNDIGINVNGVGNIIVRNTCSGNTTNNWDIVSGNVCLVVNAATAGAITGNSGGVAPGSTDPSANFTY